jgi:hypothetical protein
MSFMAKDAAQHWAEHHSAKVPFALDTWVEFVREFRLRFVEENKQDHALSKLESRSYFMGARDVFQYTDEFEDLIDLAGFEDQLVKVTKYRTGLDPVLNHTITVSSDPPDLRDYPTWRLMPTASTNHRSVLAQRRPLPVLWLQPLAPDWASPLQPPLWHPHRDLQHRQGLLLPLSHLQFPWMLTGRMHKDFSAAHAIAAVLWGTLPGIALPQQISDL